MVEGTCGAYTAIEMGATNPLISQIVEGQGGNNSPGAAPDVSVANDEKSAPKEQEEQQKIKDPKAFLSRFNAIFNDTTSNKKENDFKKLLDGYDVNLKNIYVQKAFVKMLNDIEKYEEFLKLFIVHFAAYNERIETKYLINKDQNTMRDLDAPLHSAVRQLNEGFIKWLLEQPKTEVNLRNKRRETALAILCQKYDSVSKLKTRLEEIGKELETADETKKIELDAENIELVALEKQLKEKMNTPTILKLIKRLLEKGADFNIYMNDGALPFDFLRKYNTEAVLDEIINSYAKSNVAMTEIPPKQLNNSAEGKNVSKKRIVKFYKKTEDMDVRVTVELLEIFIWFQDLETFKHYWKDFTVTTENVKKVITLLLHVAVERNYKPYVDQIIEKGSKEIFKLEENKAADTDKPTQNETSAEVFSSWRYFKCWQKRHYSNSQTQNEVIDHGAIASNSQDQCAVASSRTQDETFQQEKNEIGISQDTCAGTSKRISMTTGVSCKDNPSATEDAEPQSGTSKLQPTDAHMESGTSKLESTIPQTQSETIESQDNQPVSQDNHRVEMEGTTSDEQPSRWRCFKCCQKRHYPNSQTHGEEFELRASDSQDKCEFMSERSRWCCFKCCQNKQNPSSSEGVDFQMQGETFKQEKNEIGNSQDTCAGTSKRICMNAGGSCKDNLSATEGAEPRTESGTSKLPATDPPVSQDTTPATRMSDEQPSGWCCLKCFQKKQNPPPPDETNRQAQRQNSKDCRLTKAEEKRMVHRNELKGLLKMVCLNGNKALLTMFLKEMNDIPLVNDTPLLIFTIEQMSKVKKIQKFKNLQDCATTLIENHGKIRMQDTDPSKNTALHLALRYGYDKITSLLLKEGHGLMGLMNKHNLTPIEYGTTEFWNGFLNKSIMMNTETELSFNVGFLGPLAKEESTYVKPSKASKVSTSQFKFVKPVAQMSETHNSKYRFTRTVNDMTALRLISQSPDRKEFLMHPVIIAFITMKWKRLCHWHILNLLLTTFTMGTFIGYTLCLSEAWKWVFGTCVIVAAFIISFREFMQWFLLRWSYVTLENIVDILNVLFIGIALLSGCERDGWLKYVPALSSFVFVSLALQATFLLGATWNNLFITLYMFKTVSSSFFYSFLSFSPVIVAFICSFYQMYNEPSDITIINGTESNSSEENFNNFPSFLNATIKTLVMTTGEFEAANIDFDGGKWLLFGAFLFIAPIVILNLINGLAVSDIAAIRQESEFISICRKIKLLELYERAIVESRSKMPGCFQCLFRDPFFPSPFFEKYESVIYVNVNEKNKLAIRRKKKKNSTKKSIENKASNENRVNNGTTCNVPSASNNQDDVVGRPQESNIDRSLSNNNNTGNEPGEESTPTDNASNKNLASNRTTSNVTSASNNQKDGIKRSQESNNDRSTSNINDTGNERHEESNPTSNNTSAPKGSAKIASNELELISGFYWLPDWFLTNYIGIRSFQLVLYMSLDQSYVNKAKTIARRQYKNNLGRGTNELADPEQTDRPAMVNKTAMNQHKTPTLSSSATGPSVPDSRDKQIEKLQEEVRNIVAMLTDIQQQLTRSHASKAESTASTSRDHSRVQ